MLHLIQALYAFAVSYILYAVLKDRRSIYVGSAAECCSDRMVILKFGYEL